MEMKTTEDDSVPDKNVKGKIKRKTNRLNLTNNVIRSTEIRSTHTHTQFFLYFFSSFNLILFIQ